MSIPRSQTTTTTSTSSSPSPPPSAEEKGPYPCTRRSFLPRICRVALTSTIPFTAATAALALTDTTTTTTTSAAQIQAAPPAPPTPPQPIPLPIGGIGGAPPLRPYIIESTTTTPYQTPRLITKLGQERIGTVDLSPLSQSLSPFAEPDLYYPMSFIGEWDVRATLRRKTYPYGVAFVPSLSLVEGSPRYRYEGVDDTTTYKARYYDLDDETNTNTNTNTNNHRIIADRRFNSISASRAYDQLTPVDDVLWDPLKDPTVLKVQFAPGALTKDMMPIGPRRAEVYLTARRRDGTTTTSSTTSANDNNNNNNTGTDFVCTAERSRQVVIGAGSIDVFDTETITEFEILPIDGDGNGKMRAVQRIAAFLTPNPNSKEGALWQQVGGKAIALFEYSLEMQKV